LLIAAVSAAALLLPLTAAKSRLFELYDLASPNRMLSQGRLSAFSLLRKLYALQQA
jgi:hypothetical protein